jgi:nucleoid DNA-binding protein
MALTKDNIVDELVSQYGLVRREALDIVDTFFDDIKTRVTTGGRVRLMNTGVFYLKKQSKHRKRRDIEVTEDTAPWTTVSFKSSQVLRNRIQRADVEVARDVD